MTTKVEYIIEPWELQQKQSLPLSAKISLAKSRIVDWYNYWSGEVYVSFSGGKDSTVVLELVRSIYPDVQAVFIDTGMELPEVRRFVLKQENVLVMKPRMPFYKVLDKYGYPVVSKRVSHYIKCIRSLRRRGVPEDNRTHQYMLRMLPKKWKHLVDAPFKISEICCDVMKKQPMHKFQKETGLKPISGEMAGDSRLRREIYLRYGCNYFSGENARSKPLSVWLESDILEYIRQNNIEISPVYGEIIEKDNKLFCSKRKNTGCMFCTFGAHMEKKPNRYQLLYYEHPKLWKYCLNRLNMKQVLDWIGIPYCPEC